MNKPSGPRGAAKLSKSTTHQLHTYALAASAAGVGVLALSGPAQAKIVYTPAHLKIPIGNPFMLDLNHDGVTDLSFLEETSTAGSGLRLYGPKANAVIGYDVRQTGFASALKAGVRVGPKKKFVDASFAIMLAYNRSSGSVGAWKDLKNRYLGVKFSIKGKTHFGWVRLNVFRTNGTVIAAVITGYAYETIAAKSIVAGKTKGPNDNLIEAPELSLTAPAPQSATLGMLAVGAPGLSIAEGVSSRAPAADRRHCRVLCSPPASIFQGPWQPHCPSGAFLF
jgi:hypothetical protein